VSLIKLSNLLKDAESGCYAVGYFEAWDTYSMEAVVEAAEEENAPVVIGIGGLTMNQDWLERFAVKPMGAYGRVIAENTKVPTALILNEVKRFSDIELGIGAGYNTVMLDSCNLPDDENIVVTKKVVELARPYGIEVQAEFGRLPNFGEDAAGVLTDPDKAVDFVKETGVNLLAVSIGNVHLQTEGKSNIDIVRLKAIREKVSVPLVIHGGTGFPDDKVREVIKTGVSFFHFGTLMKKAFLEAAKISVNAIGNETVDYQATVGSRKPTDILIPCKYAIKEVVKKYMRLYGASGKAN
jgi:fructose-bisphosphate aldolase class II